MSTKTEQTQSTEQKLAILYQLQTILTEIDRIRQLRGELPLEVKDQEDYIEQLKTRIDNYKKDIDTIKKSTLEEQAKLAKAKANYELHTKQKEEVRNSREYDALDKEALYDKTECELCEKHISANNRMIDEKKSEIKVTDEQLNDAKHVLEEKKAELNDIVSETKADEENLRDAAHKLEENFEDKRLLKSFKRIRENNAAHNGLGIVSIERDACGGCFNRIPPQRQVEIRMHKKVIVCEYCGRILIDPELTGND